MFEWICEVFQSMQQVYIQHDILILLFIQLLTFKTNHNDNLWYKRTSLVLKVDFITFK